MEAAKKKKLFCENTMRKLMADRGADRLNFEDGSYANLAARKGSDKLTFTAKLKGVTFDKDKIDAGLLKIKA